MNDSGATTFNGVLSDSERATLGYLLTGDNETPDWVALQRLKQFGLAENGPTGRPRITAVGRRVIKGTSREPGGISLSAGPLLRVRRAAPSKGRNRHPLEARRPLAASR